MRIAQNHLGPQEPPATRPSEDLKTYTLGPANNKVELVYDVMGDPLGLRDVLPSTEQLYDRAVILVKKGLASQRFDTQGFGESQPIADNTTPEGRLKNRRLEFAVQEETP